VKSALVCGAGGFIGSHLVKRLKREGFWVRGVDLKFPRFSETEADDFIVGDLRDLATCREAVDRDLMKSTSSPLTWEERDIFSPGKTTPT